jgi:hypothetical protein
MQLSRRFNFGAQQLLSVMCEVSSLSLRYVSASQVAPNSYSVLLGLISPAALLFVALPNVDLIPSLPARIFTSSTP